MRKGVLLSSNQRMTGDGICKGIRRGENGRINIAQNRLASSSVGKSSTKRENGIRGAIGTDGDIAAAHVDEKAGQGHLCHHRIKAGQQDEAGSSTEQADHQAVEPDQPVRSERAGRH